MEVVAARENQFKRKLAMNSHSCLKMLQRRFEESREIYVQNVSLRQSVLKWMFFFIGMLGTASFLASFFGDPGLGAEILLLTIPIVLFYFAFVLSNLNLIRSPDGEIRRGLKFANVLTALRIFLFPPILILLLRDLLVWGVGVYCIAAFTDLVDGYVARRFNQETILGIMLDPIGDIFTTGAVFYFLWIKGDVPLWLFIILVIRYTQFFLGLALLALLGAVPKLRATSAGKVVGVVQAAGIVILLVRRMFPGKLPFDGINVYLFPALGVAFLSVIVSQTVIGCKALRKTARTAAD